MRPDRAAVVRQRQQSRRRRHDVFESEAGDSGAARQKIVATADDDASEVEPGAGGGVAGDDRADDGEESLFAGNVFVQHAPAAAAARRVGRKGGGTDGDNSRTKGAGPCASRIAESAATEGGIARERAVGHQELPPFGDEHAAPFATRGIGPAVGYRHIGERETAEIIHVNAASVAATDPVGDGQVRQRTVEIHDTDDAVQISAGKDQARRAAAVNADPPE